MRATRTNDSALVVAAQSGDRRARDELVSLYLPLVYTIVGRALGGCADVDDVVQEVMLRAVQRLRMLREPANFRAWLAAITMRHVSTYLRRKAVHAERVSALDEVGDIPDAGAYLEGVTLLHVELSAQRRQVVRASRWLDPDDRALLSLWWLETAGNLTRTDVATALGASIAHAGVRVQRMRSRLDQARSIEAALSAQPRCAGLSAAMAGWDLAPNPLWRKRIARHTRSCAGCGQAAAGMVAAERLLAGFALLPVPMMLTAAVLAKSAHTATVVGAASTAVLSGAMGAGASSAGVKAGLFGQLVQAVGAHPLAATVAAGALVVGTTVTATNWPATPEPAVIVAPTSRPATTTRPTVPASATGPPRAAAPPQVTDPSTTATGVPVLGPLSLESANAPGKFVAAAGDLGVLEAAGAGNGDAAAQRATFQLVRGLAAPDCFSFRALDGRYLRHSSWRLRLHQQEATALFRGDATFCARNGSVAGSVAWESSNYPGWFLRHRGDELWVDHFDGSAAFRADSSFVVRPPLA